MKLKIRFEKEKLILFLEKLAKHWLFFYFLLLIFNFFFLFVFWRHYYFFEKPLQRELKGLNEANYQKWINLEQKREEKIKEILEKKYFLPFDKE
ncbi:hypothetical protein H5T58_02895 [Candidatus Parcubacteria bacterium]|nr:hypothetical protein [Candidatus Parcubacteria bacterium]